MKSTIGRPRKLNDAQITLIIEWHDALLEWRAQRRTLKTVAQLARELGVSHGAISWVIKRRGEFKQPSPEHRAQELRSRRQRMSEIKRRARRGPRPP